MKFRLKKPIWLAMTGLAMVLLGACASYGPKTLPRDQLDYGNSVGDSWKNQMLSNLVKIRYVDMPVFVDVGQIVSGYSLETQVNGSIGFNNSFTGGDSQVLGASGTYTDRPTITYVPKTGEDYLRSLLEPVNPSSLLALVLAGYNPKLLFTWAVESVNGVKNYSATNRNSDSADPRFIEYLGLLSELQAAGAIGFELEKDPETSHESILFFPNKNLSEEIRKKRERASELIGLKPGHERFRVLYSPFAIDDDVLAIQTRSILQMLIAMSGFVDVPADKINRTAKGYSIAPGTNRPFHVRTSPDKPDDAFAIFKYHGDWYWIDHEDIESKQVFTLMLFVTTLTNSADPKNAAVLTIPTS